MKKLTQKQMLNIVLKDLKNWLDMGEDDSSMSYAYRNGYFLHAANLWLWSGAASESLDAKIKGLKISHHAERIEINKLCAEAHIYICPDCKHHAFLDLDEGERIKCSYCGEEAVKQPKKGT